MSALVRGSTRYARAHVWCYLRMQFNVRLPTVISHAMQLFYGMHARVPTNRGLWLSTFRSHSSNAALRCCIYSKCFICIEGSRCGAPWGDAVLYHSDSRKWVQLCRQLRSSARMSTHRVDASRVVGGSESPCPMSPPPPRPPSHHRRHRRCHHHHRCRRCR